MNNRSFDWTPLMNIFDYQNLHKEQEKIKFLILLLNYLIEYDNFYGFFCNLTKKIIFEINFKQLFSNSDLFDLFKNNKQILLLLFEKKIIHIDSNIIKYLLDKSDRFGTKYCLYFYPEIKEYINEEAQKSIEKELFNNNFLPDFENHRLKGENESLICSIIRKDLIDDFKLYIKNNNINCSIKKIKSSIFETNYFLLGKDPFLIEYAAFVSSPLIFQYLKLKEVEFDSTLSKYVSQNPNLSLIFLRLYEFNYFKNQNKIRIMKSNLNNIFQKCSFHYYSEHDKEINDLLQKKNENKIIVIDEYHGYDGFFFIICFDYHLFLIKQVDVFHLKTFFEKNNDSKVFVLSKDKEFWISNFQNIVFSECIYCSDDSSFQKNIHYYEYFAKNFSIRFQNKNCTYQIINFWQIICKCISGFLVQKAIKKSAFNRYEHSNDLFEQSPIYFEMKKNDYIKLGNLGYGSSSFIELIFHIQTETMYVLKISYDNNTEKDKLFTREKNNYQIVHHPFLANCFGTAEMESDTYLAIEYINGQTLDKFEDIKLDFNDKIRIAFEILTSIKYLHEKELIYRDLKPNNIMIDEFKTAILIDFDRMIKYKTNYVEQMTADFTSDYMAPEIKEGKSLSFKSDIYSIGKIIQYIFFKKNPNDECLKKESFSNVYLQLKLIIDKCIENDPYKRPTIFQLIDIFVYHFINYLLSYYENNFNSSIQYFESAAEHNDKIAQCFLGIFYCDFMNVPNDINKSIYYFTLAAEQNDHISQYYLGSFYLQGKHIARDIDKSLHYLSLSAEQKNISALFLLGVIYCEGKFINKDVNKGLKYLEISSSLDNQFAQLYIGKLYFNGIDVEKNINKSIIYFNLSANQNNAEAQYYLGLIYYTWINVFKDIDKAIHYLKLSSDQNNCNSQTLWGNIFYRGIYKKKDMKKAIYYFTLSANQNEKMACYTLGYLYYKGIYLERNIEKAIKYLKTASDQNVVSAHFLLGLIYYDGKFVQIDIKKAIYYFHLASDQNDCVAQFILGKMYYEGKYVRKDINLALKFFDLSSKQNYQKAQLYLGVIYYEDKYVKKDINKSIHYLLLASEQNNSDAQYFIGKIYYEAIDVTRDISSSIHYLTLSANQNCSNAQNMLGIIYYDGKYVTKDIKKSIHYFNQAISQNHPQSYYFLGGILYEGIDVPRDINKAIQYLTYSSNYNDEDAQFLLGRIYYEDLYVKRDINKSIKYLTLAANQNQKNAQFLLGKIYYDGKYTKRNINKSIYYLKLSAEKYVPNAMFLLGKIFYDGIFISRDIAQSIRYLKDASSLNDASAKNLLGIIYKNGDGVDKNIGRSIEYFQEAIKQKDDSFAMFNLSRIYYFGVDINKNISKSIELLEKASNNNLIFADLFLFYIYSVQNDKKAEFYLKRINEIHQFNLSQKLNKNNNYDKKSLIFDRFRDFMRIFDLIHFDENAFINFLYFIDHGKSKQNEQSVNFNSKIQPIPINEYFYKGFNDE